MLRLAQRLRADGAGRRPGGPSGRRRDPLQEAKLVEHLSQTQRDTGHWLVGDRDGQSSLLAEQLVQAAEEGPATGEDDSLVDDVGRELGRDPLEARVDGV